MELTREQILKHKDQILNVLNEVTVKSHQARSKKGTVFTVKQHERKINVGDTIVVKDGRPLGGSTGKVVSVKPGNGDDDLVTWHKTSGVSALGLHGDYASNLQKVSGMPKPFLKAGDVTTKTSKRRYKGISHGQGSSFRELRKLALKQQHELYLKNK